MKKENMKKENMKKENMKKENMKKENKLSGLSIENLTFQEYLNIESNDVNYKKKKVVLTITIDAESCRKLKRLVPEGEVSKFAAKIIKEGIRKIEEKVFREYAKVGQNEELEEKLEKLSIS